MCLEDADVALQPCEHAVCRTCVARWFQTKPTCPLCRTVAVVPRSNTANDLRTVCIETDGLSHVGITITSVSNRRMRVLYTCKRDLAYANGIRKGDIIRDINGIAFHSSDNAVTMIDCATRIRVPLSFNLEIPRHGLRFRLRRVSMFARD